jgi:hypothetical protein
MKKISLIVVVIVLTITGVLPQVPQTFNYQATLRDNNGQLLSSVPVTIRIGILKESNSGESVYSEIHNITTTRQGIIILKVGTGASTDNFESINWSASSYYLKVEVDPAGGNNFVTMGINEFSSVPYAFSSKESEKVEWQNVQNKPELFGGDYNDLSNLPIIPDNTNQLTNGAGFITEFEEKDPFFIGSPSKNITDGNLTNWNSAFAWGNHASAGYITASSFANLTNKTGNISMFTNDMNYAVMPSLTGNTGRFLSTNGSQVIWKYAVSDANSPLMISNNIVGITKASAISDGYLSSDDWNFFFNKAPSPWVKKGNNVYFNDGKVGIGTLDPDRILHVEKYIPDGEIREMVYIRNLSSSNSAYTGLNLRADDYNYGLGISFTSSNYNLIQDFHQIASMMTNGRAFAISCTSPEGSIRLFTNTDNNGIIERMRIDSKGYIGFGTKNPKAKVEVADGDVYISSIDKGIIMISPDGQCWRGTINNSGTLEFTSVECP